MGQFVFTTGVSDYSLDDHSSRHENGGADEISLTGLSGEAADMVAKSLYDAYTMLMATSDNTPVALSVTEQTLIGRKTGGTIAALSGADALLAMGITPLVAELNYVDGVTSAIQGQIDLKAPLASPTFTGTVTLPAVTLGGTVALSGQTLDGGAGTCLTTSTGAGLGFRAEITNAGTIGAAFIGFHKSSSPAVDDLVCRLQAYGNLNGGTPDLNYGELEFKIETMGAGIESGKLEIWLATGGVFGNHALTLSSTGLLWADVGFNADEYYQVAGTQVVGARVVDARCDDAINSGDATTDGVIDALRDAMISHGLISAA